MGKLKNRMAAAIEIEQNNNLVAQTERRKASGKVQNEWGEFSDSESENNDDFQGESSDIAGKCSCSVV